MTTANVQAKSLPTAARVVVLGTGGTIAGSGQAHGANIGYTAGTVPVAELLAGIEAPAGVALTAEQISQIDSKDMDFEVWHALRARCAHWLKQPDVVGVVVTHGTDTVEETAYFLDLVVRSAKPVVLVGSMRPATALSADGPMNLYDAVRLAGSPEAKGKGVLVTLNGMIHAAREVTKTNTMTTDTFRSTDLGALGYMVSGKPMFYRGTARKHTTDSEFDVSKLDKLPAVNVVYSYANATRTAIDAFAAAGDVGIVHAGTGNGSLSTPVKAALTEARKKGMIVVRSSRTGTGITARNGEANDDELDFVAGDNLSPQKARILLMLGLTKTQNTKDLQRMFMMY
jgi:L-asparaginase type II